MSAFIVSRATMLTLGAALGDSGVLGAVCCAYALATPYGDSPSAVTRRNKVRVSVLKRWAQANQRAVCARYGEPFRSPSVPRTFAPPPHDRSGWTAAIKAIDCLDYQCSEDVPPDEADVHRMDRVALACAKAEMAGYIIDRQDPYYAAARWD
jgi:hypothetical protein